jgi:hypothetical protein
MATDAIIEKTMIDTFLTLNEFSGIQYIKKDAKGNLTNVALPNKFFTQPQDKRFFVLSVVPNVPDTEALGTNARNRYTGFMQIDIGVPLNAGKDEVFAKQEAMTNLFFRGKSIPLVDGNLTIMRTYKATEDAEDDLYRVILRIEFQASLPK